jgi:DNA polymerase III epsilon subunit-like protein
VAHNATFDLSFLRAELARNGLPPPRGSSVDTRILAKKAFPGFPSYSLVNLAASFGIDAGNSHRALDDARSCMELMLRCAAVAVCDCREVEEGREKDNCRDLPARGGEALGARA